MAFRPVIFYFSFSGAWYLELGYLGLLNKWLCASIDAAAGGTPPFQKEKKKKHDLHYTNQTTHIQKSSMGQNPQRTQGPNHSSFRCIIKKD